MRTFVTVTAKSAFSKQNCRPWQSFGSSAGFSAADAVEEGAGAAAGAASDVGAGVAARVGSGCLLATLVAAGVADPELEHAATTIANPPTSPSRTPRRPTFSLRYSILISFFSLAPWTGLPPGRGSLWCSTLTTPCAKVSKKPLSKRFDASMGIRRSASPASGQSGGRKAKWRT